MSSFHIIVLVLLFINIVYVVGLSAGVNRIADIHERMESSSTTQ
jgi:hypothetical protein